jgi:hypothetical protein
LASEHTFSVDQDVEIILGNVSLELLVGDNFLRHSEESREGGGGLGRRDKWAGMITSAFICKRCLTNRLTTASSLFLCVGNAGVSGRLYLGDKCLRGLVLDSPYNSTQSWKVKRGPC